MRSVILGLFVLMSTAVNGVTLTGELTQGSLLRGNAQPGTNVWLNGTPIKTAEDGSFVFGFGRKSPLTHLLEWQLPNGQKASQALVLSEREYAIQRIDGLPSNMVSPPEDVLKRIREDSRRVALARKTDDDRVDFMMDFIWPADGRISGVYGSQRILNGEPRRPHFGIDVAAPTGTPVYAPANGIVTLFVPDMYYSGGTMILDHGHGVSSTFLHLHKAHVNEGETVNQGQLIGEIGASGRATGPHLDWRINWFTTRVDPELLVPPRSEKSSK